MMTVPSGHFVMGTPGVRPNLKIVTFGDHRLNKFIFLGLPSQFIFCNIN